jgi:hypothetical protein
MHIYTGFKGSFHDNRYMRVRSSIATCVDRAQHHYHWTARLHLQHLETLNPRVKSSEPMSYIYIYT